MPASVAHEVSECTPTEAWDALSRTASLLVDVRTRPEWNFVGLPDLSGTASRLVMWQWRRFPDMSISDTFAADLASEAGDLPDAPMFFICRSGSRSMDAAKAMAAWLGSTGKSGNCVNVQGGFEGDLDNDRRRGTINGWKVSGLPWQQN